MNKTVSVGGLPLMFLTGLLAYLKVEGHLDIGWFWVFLPIGFPIALLFLFWIGFLSLCDCCLLF